MKKISVILSMLTLLILFVGCEDENVKKLKREIKLADRECPVNMGMIGDMLNIKYDERKNEVQVYFSINDEIVSLDALKNNGQLAKNSMKLSINRKESSDLWKMITNAGAGLSVTFKSASTGKSFEIKIPVDELKEIIKNPLSEIETNKLLLENQLAMENSRSPYSVAEGMQLVKVFDDGNNIVYEYSLDEDLYDISLFNYAKDEIKSNAREIFNDPVMKRNIETINSLGKGLIIRYSGKKTGKSADISFTSDELNKFIYKY